MFNPKDVECRVHSNIIGLVGARAVCSRRVLWPVHTCCSAIPNKRNQRPIGKRIADTVTSKICYVHIAVAQGVERNSSLTLQLTNAQRPVSISPRGLADASNSGEAGSRHASHAKATAIRYVQHTREARVEGQGRGSNWVGCNPPCSNGVDRYKRNRWRPSCHGAIWRKHAQAGIKNKQVCRRVRGKIGCGRKSGSSAQSIKIAGCRAACSGGDSTWKPNCARGCGWRARLRVGVHSPAQGGREGEGQ